MSKWSRNKFTLTIDELFQNSDISSESEEEDDFNLLFEDTFEAYGAEKNIHRRNCIKNYAEVIVPSYSDVEFASHFRVSRELADWLTARFERSSYYKDLSPSKVTPAYKQVLVSLWFAGHEGCGYIELKDRFDISLGSAWNFIRRLTCFLSDMSAEFIKFPNNEEQKQTARYILRTKGFPGVIGLYFFLEQFFM